MEPSTPRPVAKLHAPPMSVADMTLENLSKMSDIEVVVVSNAVKLRLATIMLGRALAHGQVQYLMDDVQSLIQTSNNSLATERLASIERTARQVAKCVREVKTAASFFKAYRFGALKTY